MPYKSEKIPLPRELKRNIKLTVEKRKEIRLIRMMAGYAYNQIARAYGVSKRLVIFICNPEIEKRSRERFKELQKDGRYYKKEENTKNIRETRRYKQNLYINKIIK